MKVQEIGQLRGQLESVEGELAELRAQYQEACHQREALLADKAQMEKEVGLGLGRQGTSCSPV